MHTNIRVDSAASALSRIVCVSVCGGMHVFPHAQSIYFVLDTAGCHWTYCQCHSETVQFENRMAASGAQPHFFTRSKMNAFNV